MEAGTAIFSLRQISKTFKTDRDEVCALRDITLDIMQGEIIGIIGMSGAGKSTLVRLLNRLETPSKGAVYFGDRDLARLSIKEMDLARKSIGMIFQQFNLLTQRTVRENIALALAMGGVPKKERRVRVDEVLGLVGLESKAEAYPATLSGGQSQRVAIARALATRPRVLLCDEATSALDPTTTKEILGILQDINTKLGITIVVITHEMQVVERICDRVAILDDGALAEMGRVQEIFRNPKTPAAKRLVYPGDDQIVPLEMLGERCVRIAFDGRSAKEAVIADLVLSTGERVNILAANTKSVGGIAYGQMIVGLPQGDAAADRVLDYLKNTGMAIEEVTEIV